MLINSYRNIFRKAAPWAKVQLLTASLLLGLSYIANAQCPGAACIPGNATDPTAPDFHTGISSVVLGAFNDAHAIGTNLGYRDNSCNNRNISVVAGVPYTIRVANGDLAEENVRVWVDLNNSNTFEGSELLFSSNGAVVHTGSITFPSTAVLGTPLRIRFGSDLSSSPVPTPCGTPELGQFIDYQVTVSANTQPPAAFFSSPDTVNCSGNVRFFDNSTNFPQIWSWTFGDGGVSTDQNPVHHYNSTGTYSVTLTVTNLNGTSTLTRQNYVIYNGSSPIPATCTPLSTTQCCGYTLTNIKTGTINSTGAAFNSGYTDFSCQYQTTAVAGSQVPFSGTVGTAAAQDIKVWIDFNNNGSLADNGELVYTGLNLTGDFSSNLLLFSSAAVLGTPLRMRVSSDFSGSAFGPCSNLTSGYIQDFGITLAENTAPPVASFTADSSALCTGSHTFTFTGGGNAQSFIWDFGDGDIDTVYTLSTTHTYINPGRYSVRLTVTNNIGTASTVKTNYITYTSGPKPATCTAQTSANWGFNTGIVNFTFGNLNNSSENGSVGYQDFTCGTFISVIPGASMSYSVQTGQAPELGAIYIDIDTGGSFNGATERYGNWNASNQLHTGIINIPANFPMDVPVRLRIVTNTQGPGGGNVNPCTTVMGQSEDYTLFAKTPTEKPVAGFNATSVRTCVNEDITFTDASTNVPNSRAWNFGDSPLVINGATTVVHAFTTPGVYSVSLIAGNNFGFDTVIVQVTVTERFVMTNACQNVVSPNINQTQGIYNVTFGTINNNTSSANAEGDLVFSCLSSEFVAGYAYPISITTYQQQQDNIAVYIDFNNNGDFTDAERVFTSSRAFGTRTGSVFIPASAVLNTPLRMRVSEDTRNTIPVACGSLFGQAEDYPVIFRVNTLVPIANFGTSVRIACDGTVAFTDSSQNAPTFWRWDFGDQSNIVNGQNPTHIYRTPGTYTVTLISGNDNGTDTAVRVQYITIPPASDVVTTTCFNTTQQNPSANYSINTFSFADLSYTSEGPTKVYADRTCYLKATVDAGSRYNVSLNSFFVSNMGVYVDWNNDGIFTISEAIALTGATPARTLAASVFIPAGAVTVQSLRMRVIVDYGIPNTISPCGQLVMGHSEDFSLKVNAVSTKPVPNFGASSTNTCSKTITFSDSSTNLPSQFYWSFGDGGHSTEQNPVYTYSAPGVYTVKLVATNAFGADSLIRTAYITITEGHGLLASVCTPSVTRQTIATGINFITFNTATGTVPVGKYTDYSCERMVTVTAGNAYNISLTTPQASNSAGYADWNNDGMFTADEKFMVNLASTNHSATLTVPQSATIGQAVRLRFISDATQNINSACGTILFGNSFDVSVYVLANTLSPDAAFRAVNTTSCNGWVVFVNKTQNVPATYRWDFGDNTAGSTAESPSHLYEGVGTYTVKLYATNSFGTDSVILLNYVTVSDLTGPRANSCSPATISYSPGLGCGVRNVLMGTINSATGTADEGYKDFTCEQRTEIVAGNRVTLTLTFSQNTRENARAWIDYNDNGVFETTEVVASFFNTFRSVTSTFVVPNNCVKYRNLRMRIMDDYASSPALASACQDLVTGQAEDYSVYITDPLGTAPAKSLSTLEIYPNPGSGLFNITSSFSNATDVKLEVFSSAGKSVWQAIEEKVTNLNRVADLSGLPKGFYMLRVASANGVTAHRLIIQ
ncbi:MAG: GEVED domain-containing protein [Bacteroidota bacterium]